MLCFSDLFGKYDKAVVCLSLGGVSVTSYAVKIDDVWTQNVNLPAILAAARPLAV